MTIWTDPDLWVPLIVGPPLNGAVAAGPPPCPGSGRPDVVRPGVNGAAGHGAPPQVPDPGPYDTPQDGAAVRSKPSGDPLRYPAPPRPPAGDR